MTDGTVYYRLFYHCNFSFILHSNVIKIYGIYFNEHQKKVPVDGIGNEVIIRYAREKKQEYIK